MSQAGIASLSKSGGGGLIQTILGDTGSITGSTVTIFANNATNLNGSSVQFINSGTVSTFRLMDANSNIFLGNFAGNLTNIAAVGNIGIGYFALNAITNGRTNVSIGQTSGLLLQSGQNNVFLGIGAGQNLISGLENTLIGAGSGLNYASNESWNIIIGNTNGTVGDSNTMRLGNDGANAITQTFIQGITGVTVSNAKQVGINSSTGQLGVVNTSLGSWSDISGAVNATSGNGYFVNATATSTLPVSPANGDTISYIVDTSNILTIQASPGQSIRIGATVSAPAGTAKSNARGNAVTLVFRTTTNSWISNATNGNWTVV